MADHSTSEISASSLTPTNKPIPPWKDPKMIFLLFLSLGIFIGLMVWVGNVKSRETFITQSESEKEKNNISEEIKLNYL